eukprot:356283-Chlamydomonas_euryale.AAC.1
MEPGEALFGLIRRRAVVLFDVQHSGQPNGAWTARRRGLSVPGAWTARPRSPTCRPFAKQRLPPLFPSPHPVHHPRSC